MGSLMPGWDSTPPKAPGMDDDEDLLNQETQHQEGYFARYEAQKSLRHAGADGSSSPSSVPLGPMPSLSRTSAPLTPLDASLHVSLARTSVPASQVAPSKSKRYEYTHWEDELDSLRRGKGPSPQPSAPPAALTSHHHEEGPVDLLHRGSWWSHLETGALNEHPDVAENGKGAKAPFRPQHNVTGQGMNYRQQATSDH